MNFAEKDIKAPTRTVDFYFKIGWKSVDFALHLYLKDETKLCNEDLINAFEQELLKTPMAWMDSDKKCLQELLWECARNLEAQFGRLDFNHQIDWEFTHGLSINRSRNND